MPWNLITKQTVESIKIGDALAKDNPEAAPVKQVKKDEESKNVPLEAIYEVTHISEPEISEITLKSQTFLDATTIRKKSELIDQKWWLLQ